MHTQHIINTNEQIVEQLFKDMRSIIYAKLSLKVKLKMLYAAKYNAQYFMRLNHAVLKEHNKEWFFLFFPLWIHIHALYSYYFTKLAPMNINTVKLNFFVALLVNVKLKVGVIGNGYFFSNRSLNPNTLYLTPYFAVPTNSHTVNASIRNLNK